MVPKLPTDLPKDRQATMLATVKIDSTSASCPTGMDHRLVSQPSSSIGHIPEEQSTLPELSYFNVDDFLNAIDRLNENLNDSNGGLNGEQFMNLAKVSHGCPLHDNGLTSPQVPDAHDMQCKVVGLEIEDVQQHEDLREIEMDRNNERVEAAVPTADGEIAQNARRKRSFDLCDPTLASMFYPGNACLEPLAKKVRIVESGSSAYLEWFSSTDTSVQHLAASDMLEVLKLPKDNAFASWVAFNTEKSTDRKEESTSNCSAELTARLAGYDYEMSPRRDSECSDYDMYWMSNSDDYLSSAPPSGKLYSVSRGGVGAQGDLPEWELLETLVSSSQSKDETWKLLSDELARNCTDHLTQLSERQMEENCIENIMKLTSELGENEVEHMQCDLVEEILDSWQPPPGELFECNPKDWRILTDEWNPEDPSLSPNHLHEWNILNWFQMSDKLPVRPKQMPQTSGELTGWNARDWHQELSKSCRRSKKTQEPSGRPTQEPSGTPRGRPRKIQQTSGRPRGRPKKMQVPSGKSSGRKPKNRQHPIEDEIDVVSVPTGRSPPAEDNLSSWDILPASTLMSEHVADLHSYSSRPAHRPPAPTRCPVTVGSASAPPSPVQRVAPPPAKRCVSNPASPLQRVPARHRKRRGTQEGGRGRGGRMKIDKDCMKRAQHNVLERERRLQLTQQFTVLRVEVPSIRNNERASKSDILNGARSFILKLKQQRMDLDETFEKETRINAQLRKTLNEAIRQYKLSRRGSM